MKTFVCDKCGQIIKPEETKVVKVYNRPDMENINYKGAYDLCSECYDDLFATIDPQLIEKHKAEAAKLFELE